MGKTECRYCRPSDNYYGRNGAYWTEWAIDTDISTGFLQNELSHSLYLHRDKKGLFEICSEMESNDNSRVLRVAVNYCPVCGRKLA